MAKTPALRREVKAKRPIEIIDAAFEEFSVHGFAATRLDDVAKRVGLTKGALYLYFSSKEDLFLATVKELMRPLMEQSAGMMTPEGSAIAILRAQLQNAADHLLADQRRRDVLRMLMADAPRFPELVDRWHAEVVDPLCAAFVHVVEYGIARGEFRPSDLTLCPHVLFAPIIMANVWMTLIGDRKPLDVRGFLATAIDGLIRGLLSDRELTSLLRASSPAGSPVA